MKHFKLETTIGW